MEPAPCTEISSAERNSVRSPADAARSAYPVASMTAFARTTPYVPSASATVAPTTRVPSVTAPVACAASQISAPALRASARNHSALQTP